MTSRFTVLGADDMGIFRHTLSGLYLAICLQTSPPHIRTTVRAGDTVFSTSLRTAERSLVFIKRHVVTR